MIVDVYQRVLCALGADGAVMFRVFELSSCNCPLFQSTTGTRAQNALVTD